MKRGRTGRQPIEGMSGPHPATGPVTSSLRAGTCVDSARGAGEKLQTQAALRASEERFRSIVENSPIGIFFVDEEYRPIYVNDEACRISGYSRDEVMGQDFRRFLDAQSRQLVADRYVRRQRGERVPPRYEFDLIRKDGRKRRVEIVSSAFKDHEGQVRTVAQIMDITDRKRMEAELEEHRQRLEELVARRTSELARERQTSSSILSSMAEGIIVVDAAGRIAYVNDAARALAGLAPRQVLGRPATAVLSSKLADPATADRRQVLFEAMRGCGPNGAQAKVQFSLTKPQRRDLLVTCFPISLGPGEEMVGLLVRDITQERDLERRRDALVSVASHELRTPMSAIVGFAELMLDRDPPPATRREWLRRISEGSKRVTAIVDDMLNVSRVQSGKLEIRPESVLLTDAVAEALAEVKPTTEKHEFRVNIRPAVPPVRADRLKLPQVLTNLLSNAVKYSPAGGRITVSARHEPKRGRVVVSVTDQGIGIAPEDRKDLFTTFHRIQRPETDGVRGSGMGLYIVKAFVELMGGSVWVTSELGKGSSFRFSIPTSQTGEASSPPSRR